jgi:hypothetical protein
MKIYDITIMYAGFRSDNKKGVPWATPFLLKY